MKKTTKILSLVMAAVLLVGASVMGTLAYLTSTASVENTFSVGSVAITLDETDVKLDGTKDTDARVDKNDYKLMPGHSYTKDPIVHFVAKSEASWLFVKVENNIAGAESTAEGYKNIATQISENGWTALTGVDNVYYKEVAANTTDADTDYPVFASFAISDSLDGTALAAFNEKTIVVNAYAVQKDGFDTAIAAWNATFGASQE